MTGNPINLADNLQTIRMSEVKLNIQPPNYQPVMQETAQQKWTELAQFRIIAEVTYKIMI